MGSLKYLNINRKHLAGKTSTYSMTYMGISRYVGTDYECQQLKNFFLHTALLASPFVFSLLSKMVGSNICLYIKNNHLYKEFLLYSLLCEKKD
jgi:hypothetical protein